MLNCNTCTISHTILSVLIATRLSSLVTNMSTKQ